jgi:hypothetical protein
MADQEYEKLKLQIKDLKESLSQSADDPQQTRDIEDALKRLQVKALSYAERGSNIAPGEARATSPTSPTVRSVVNDPYMQEEEEEVEEARGAESAAIAAAQKSTLERNELSERARENLLQISQAPDTQLQVLPSGKPGVDYAQQTMIHALQTKLAPAFVLERLEAKPLPTSKTKPEENIKPKPQAKQKVKITFRKKVEGDGEAEAQGEGAPRVDIIDKRGEDIVNRADILERLRAVLPVHVSKASDSKPVERKGALLPHKHSFIPNVAAA